MNGIDLSQLRLGDVLQLRKPHPCGSKAWAVTRLGADIGLRCQTCGRRMMLDRLVLERRITALLERGQGPTADELLELTNMTKEEA